MIEAGANKMEKFSNTTRKLSVFGFLWAAYALSFPLSVKKTLRLNLADFSIHPAMAVLAVIVILYIPFASRFKLSRAKSYISGGYTYVFMLILSTYVNFLSNGYPFNVRYIVKWAVFFITVILIVTTVKKITEIHLLLKALVFSIALICVYGIIISYMMPTGDSHVNPFRDLATQNALSNWSAGIFILSLYLLETAKRLKEKLIWFCILMIIVGTQFFTMSRFGWLLIMMSFLAFLIVAGKKKHFIYFILFASGFSIFLYMLELNQSMYTDRLKNRFKTFSTQGRITKSLRQRTIHGEKTFYLFLDNPLIGVGSENYSRYYYQWEYNYDDIKPPSYREASHNQYFKIISETGLFGILILSAIILKIIQVTAKSYKNKNSDKKLIKILWISVAMCFLRGLTSHEVLFIPTSAFILGLAIAYTEIINRQHACTAPQIILSS